MCPRLKWTVDACRANCLLTYRVSQADTAASNEDLLHGPQGIEPDAAVARRHRRKQSLPALVVAVRSTDAENGAFAVVVGSFPSGTQRRS